MVEMKIHRIDKDIELPSYAREHDVAFDLRSAEDALIRPGEKKLLRTGLRMEIPIGHAGIIKDRSGIANKHHMHCMAGVIDPGFRGELHVMMHNLGKENFTVERNMRIAQMIIHPVTYVDLKEVDDLDDNTDRGRGGMGSTGLHSISEKSINDM